MAGRDERSRKEGLQKAKADAQRRQSERGAPKHHERAREQGRGREAERVREIPWPGWKDILWRVYGEITEDRVLMVAASVTFYLLLAFVPALSVLVSIFGLIADPTMVQEQLAALQGVIPGGGLEILQDQLTRLISQETGTLGLTFILSLAIALWTINAGVKALFDAMNVAYDETEQRSFIKLNLVALGFTIAAITMAALLIGLVVIMPVALKFVGLGSGVEWLVWITGYIAFFLLGSFGVAALYRFGPSRAHARWRWLTPGSIVTVLVWFVASLLFSWYVGNFGSYDATYGSLGAIIGFMVWIWISMIVLVVGAELNSEIEHQTAWDTTTGPPQPLGSRGATMADTVGQAMPANPEDGEERV
jgi:membrane protein